MKKWWLSIVLLVLLVGCQQPTQSTSDNPNNSTQDPATTADIVKLDLDESLTARLTTTPLSLHLEKSADNMSRLVAQVDNQSDLSITNIKINVHYNVDNVDRILYLAQTTSPKTKSEQFRILGPTTNELKDIVIKDVTIGFEDGTQTFVSNDFSSTPTTVVENSQTPEVDLEGATIKTYSFYRFGNIAMEADDVKPTLSITKDSPAKLVATFENNSKYQITEYSLTLFDGSTEKTMKFSGQVAVKAISPQFGAFETTLENLDHVTIKSLKVVADYDQTSTVITDFVLSGDITAKYEIKMK